MAYNCDSEDGNAAQVLVTMLETGDVIALCGGCWPAFVDSAYATMHADDPAPTPEPAEAPEADTPPAKAKGKGRAKAEHPAEDVQAPAGDVEPVDLEDEAEPASTSG